MTAIWQLAALAAQGQAVTELPALAPTRTMRPSVTPAMSIRLRAPFRGAQAPL